MAPNPRVLSSATRSLDMTMYELADPQAESILEATPTAAWPSG